MSISKLNNSKSLLIYDGYCYLCSNTVRHILRLDKDKKIKFISLENALADPKINKLISVYNSVDTVLLFHNQKLFIKSDAIIEISKITGGWLKIFRIMLLLPKRYRNLLYDLVARYRYRIFGKRKKCYLPPEEFTDRYL